MNVLSFSLSLSLTSRSAANISARLVVSRPEMNINIKANNLSSSCIDLISLQDNVAIFSKLFLNLSLSYFPIPETEWHSRRFGELSKLAKDTHALFLSYHKIKKRVSATKHH